MEGISVKRLCVDKTIKREIAENSYRNVTSYICTVAATHFISVQKEDCKAIQYLREKGSKGANELFNYTVKALGPNVPIAFVQPRNILTTDDVATFWVPSLVSQKTNLNLVPSEVLKQTGVRSVYTCDIASNNNGIRIKYTHTFSNAG